MMKKILPLAAPALLFGAILFGCGDFFAFRPASEEAGTAAPESPEIPGLYLGFNGPMLTARWIPPPPESGEGRFVGNWSTSGGGVIAGSVPWNGIIEFEQDLIAYKKQAALDPFPHFEEGDTGNYLFYDDTGTPYHFNLHDGTQVSAISTNNTAITMGPDPSAYPYVSIFPVSGVFDPATSNEMADKEYIFIARRIWYYAWMGLNAAAWDEHSPELMTGLQVEIGLQDNSSSYDYIPGEWIDFNAIDTNSTAQANDDEYIRKTYGWQADGSNHFNFAPAGNSGLSRQLKTDWSIDHMIANDPYPGGTSGEYYGDGGTDGYAADGYELKFSYSQSFSGLVPVYYFLTYMAELADDPTRWKLVTGFTQPLSQAAKDALGRVILLLEGTAAHYNAFHAAKHEERNNSGTHTARQALAVYHTEHGIEECPIWEIYDELFTGAVTSSMDGKVIFNGFDPQQ